MKRYDGPCPPNCENRKPCCQSTCENYIAFRKRKDEERAMRLEHSKRNSVVNQYVRDKKTAILHAKSRESR